MIVDAVVAVDADTGDESWTMEKLHRSRSTTTTTTMVTLRAVVKLMRTIVELLVNDCVVVDSLKNSHSYTLLFIFENLKFESLLKDSVENISQKIRREQI